MEDPRERKRETLRTRVESESPELGSDTEGPEKLSVQETPPKLPSLPPDRAAERIRGAQGKYKKWGPTKKNCVRGVWGHAPRKF